MLRTELLFSRIALTFRVQIGQTDSSRFHSSPLVFEQQIEEKRKKREYRVALDSIARIITNLSSVL